jgi:adenylate kinase family enzyme
MPQRIVVAGDPCSGKSTLAQRMASVIDAPYVELDALNWRRPSWVPAPDDELLTSMIEATRGDRWVVAGNYLRVAQPAIWPRAECVVWLDLPLRIVLPRLVRRSWQRWRSHELLWGVNYEDPWQHLRVWETDRNLFAYTVKTHHERQATFVAAMSDPKWAHIRFVRLRSPREIDAFARQFEAMAVATSQGEPQTRSS